MITAFSLLSRMVAAFLLLLALANQAYSAPHSSKAPVVVVEMEMMILPGTLEYLREAISFAEREKAHLLIVKLNTPGGMLSTTQLMIQEIFKSPVPVAVMVSPSGGTAASAGVFVTLAGHIAAMEPGTSIGAAHPVGSSGEDIEGDMRQKVENLATAMVKAISEQRGRNVSWAEESVKNSSSVTEREALKKGVIDMVVEDVQDLLVQAKGRTVTVGREQRVIPDLSEARVILYPMSMKNYAVNLFANPTIAALLWMAAAIGIWVELQSPGLIFPGVVGAIALVLALAVSQIIPLNVGGILLIVLGGALLGLELYFPSGIFGAGAVLALLLGVSYLVDVTAAPELGVDFSVVVPVLAMLMGGFFFLGCKVRETFAQPPVTGYGLLVGRKALCITDLVPEGKIRVAGEVWRARTRGDTIPKGATVVVESVEDGLLALVRMPSED